MHFVIVNHRLDNDKFIYDMSVDGTPFVKGVDQDKIQELIRTKMRLYDSFENILDSGKKSDFTIAQLIEQATIGCQAFYDKYGPLVSA